MPVRGQAGRAQRHSPMLWPFWRRWFTNDQNISADIEVVNVELSVLAHRPLAASDKKILATCRDLLEKCIANHRLLFFGNKLFVRQSLFVITQKMIAIAPKDDLYSIWSDLKQRIESSDASKRSCPDAAVKKIDKYFANSRQRGGGEKEIRGLMAQIKSTLDNRIVIDLWAASVLQRQTAFMGLISFVVAIIVMGTILFENGCLSTPLTCRFNPAESNHRLITTCLCGLLGGALSTISQPAPGAALASLPLVRVGLIRPLLGAISGFFLYLVVANSSDITFKYPTLYAAAVAIGFSERAFIKLLDAAANRVGAEVGKGIGTDEGRKRDDGAPVPSAAPVPVLPAARRRRRRRE